MIIRSMQYLNDDTPAILRSAWIKTQPTAAPLYNIRFRIIHIYKTWNHILYIFIFILHTLGRSTEKYSGGTEISWRVPKDWTLYARRLYFARLIDCRLLKNGVFTVNEDSILNKSCRAQMYLFTVGLLSGFPKCTLLPVTRIMHRVGRLK